eukprot:772539-Prymnesium_polylepis.1
MGLPGQDGTKPNTRSHARRGTGATSGKGSPSTAAQGHTPHKHRFSIEVLATLPGVRGGVRAWR